MPFGSDELGAPAPTAGPPHPAVRAGLMARACTAALEEGVVEAARRHHEVAAEHARWAREVLNGVDRRMTREVRTHVARFIREHRTRHHGSLALVGGEGTSKEPTLDVVLLAQFGRVSRVPSGPRFVARAIHDQPDIVVVHDDLAELNAVAAALLVRSCAPRSLVLIITEDSTTATSAERAGFAVCSSTITTDDLEDLLARLAL